MNSPGSSVRPARGRWLPVMAFRPVALLATLAAVGCSGRYTPCPDTLTCREQAARRDAAFAAAVAREPSPATVLEWPAPEVLVDRKARVAYVVTPTLVALDLESGAERWRAPSVNGEAVWAVGRLLAVGEQGSSIPARLAFVDPTASGKAVQCTLQLPVPAEAAEVGVDPFARRDEVLAFWKSSLSWKGGTPPEPEFEEAQRRADACGLVSIHPVTCRVEVQELGDFLFRPPEGRPAGCYGLSAGRDLPAAAASMAKQSRGSAPEILVVGDPVHESECLERVRKRLEARDPAGAVMWTHDLAEHTRDLCGPP